MIVLSDDQLKDILLGLPKYFPKSLQLEAMIRNKLSNRYSWPDTEIVADEYPDYSTLMVRPVLSAKSSNAQRCYTPSHAALFCRNIAKFEQVIRQEDFVDWSIPFGFYALSLNDVYPLIATRCEEMGNVAPLPVNDHGIMHLLNPTNLIKSELREGFYLGELAEAHSDQVNNEWHYGTSETLPYIQYILRNKFPTSAIFTTEGRLVAYILYSPDGAMFNGFVQPEYRNKGLYQVVNYDLAKKVVAMGQPIPWVYVACWNQASLNAYRKLGAEIVHSVDWILFETRKRK